MSVCVIMVRMIMPHYSKKGDILKSEKRVLYSPKRLRGSPKRQSAQGYLIIYVHTTYVTLYHRASEVEVATEASLTLLCGACRHKSNGGKNCRLNFGY